MKKLKVLSMAMISLFALTGCDVEMDLDKTNAEAPIVLEDGATTYGNKLQEIYDSVVNYGDTNSQRILNNILFAYAQVYFGEFYKLNQLVDESNVNAIKEFKAFAAKEGETDADVLVRAKIFRNSILTAITSSEAVRGPMPPTLIGTLALPGPPLNAKVTGRDAGSSTPSSA